MTATSYPLQATGYRLQATSCYPARRVVDDLDRDPGRAGKGMRQPIGPFDGKHAFRDSSLLQAQILSGRFVEAIEIGMKQGQPAAAVLVDQRECGTADFLGVDPEPGG